MIGRIIKCPVKVSETGFIRIVADQRHCKTHASKWKLLAVCWNPITQESEGEGSFEVKESEIEKWA